MSVEIQDKLIALLASVDDLKAQEVKLKEEKSRARETISAAEGEANRYNLELDDVRENQLRLKREVDSLHSPARIPVRQYSK